MVMQQTAHGQNTLEADGCPYLVEELAWKGFPNGRVLFSRYGWRLVTFKRENNIMQYSPT